MGRGATFGKDRTGPLNAVHHRPAPGRTDCPVENTVPDMVATLKKTIKSPLRLFICIDALDECTPKHRQELLRSLREIVRASLGTRVFLTGRPHINDEILECFGKALRIPLSPTYGDIMNYLEMRLNGDTDTHAMNEELRANIKKIIPEKISER